MATRSYYCLRDHTVSRGFYRLFKIHLLKLIVDEIEASKYLHSLDRCSNCRARTFNIIYIERVYYNRTNSDVDCLLLRVNSCFKAYLLKVPATNWLSLRELRRDVRAVS